jgi:hypothetical protein
MASTATNPHASNLIKDMDTVRGTQEMKGKDTGRGPIFWRDNSL